MSPYREPAPLLSEDESESRLPLVPFGLGIIALLLVGNAYQAMRVSVLEGELETLRRAREVEAYENCRDGVDRQYGLPVVPRPRGGHAVRGVFRFTLSSP